VTVLRHVVESITPASAAHAEGARLRVASAGVPLLERLAMRLGAAQHTARVRAARRTIVVVAGDHGAADPGIALGPSHPTVVAAHAIADGSAALAHLARASGAPIVLVDAGAAEPAAMPASAISLGRGPTRDLAREPAMTIVDASLALEHGIALSVSLSEGGLDLLAVGALGLGADLSAAALLDTHDDTSPLERLAAAGGSETAVLAGLMLGAASINVPVVLDGEATGAAALAACAFAPAVAGYLIAAHAGTALHRRILVRLALEPIFNVGLGHGEGTGAAMVLPLADQVAALAGRG
jgi:nicotinate-nucleotide--dimethylbenzimidazole phosphoribosyltransferase